MNAKDRAYLDAVRRGDMEAAQRMVEDAADAAGFGQQVFYHGTATAFTEPCDKGRGVICMGESRDMSEMHAELRAEDYPDRDPIIYEWYVKGDNFFDARNEPHYAKLVEVMGEYTPEPPDEDGHDWEYTEFEHGQPGAPGGIMEILEDLGFDGYWEAEGLAVFDGVLIKSADPVTYDDEGNIIPLSQRFNVESRDMRNPPRRWW